MKVCMNCIKRLDPADYHAEIELIPGLNQTCADREVIDEASNLDDVDNDFRFCSECGTELEEVSPEQYQMLLGGDEDRPCSYCEKKITCHAKFCGFCGKRVPSNENERLQTLLAYCPDCHVHCVTVDDLICTNHGYRFCERHLHPLVTMNIPDQQCPCGNTYPPWLAGCGQCGTRNPNQKSEKSIIDLLKSGG
ncbi:MAG: hypothetical protein KBB55_01470 [Candidatus Buchananbacteria bacterium]|nr:hypothetical protein [Candidatus Buchananbacteria bacterium]